VALLADGEILAAGAPAEVLRPALLRTTFGVEAEVIETPTGPVVL
jgi:ABC-type cobalamin/Fe3+-siderophores transport system ATPase subunit